MTEREKWEAGLWYDANFDEELRIEREKAEERYTERELVVCILYEPDDVVVEHDLILYGITHTELETHVYRRAAEELHGQSETGRDGHLSHYAAAEGLIVVSVSESYAVCYAVEIASGVNGLRCNLQTDAYGVRVVVSYRHAFARAVTLEEVRVFVAPVLVDVVDTMRRLTV